MKRALVKYAAAALCAMAVGAPAVAQTLPDVPRNRTLISQGWDYYNQVPSPNNLSSCTTQSAASWVRSIRSWRCAA